MIFYFDQLFTHVLPHLTEEIAGSLARLGHDGRPAIRFGTWVGGDRDGNPSVTPEVTMQVLELQHDHGLRNLITAVEEVAEELSVSSRIRPITADLAASLEEDREVLPLVWQRFRGINANEPYRLKCAFIHQRLLNTRVRILEGGRHEPGCDYDDPAELRAELS